MAVKVEDLFYNNLLLLGFDRETIKSNYGIEVNKNTFSGQGNTKAMEVVLHFLFSKISPTATKEVTACCEANSPLCHLTHLFHPF